MFDPNPVIRKWLVSTHDVSSPPPLVQAAYEQRDRRQAIASAHWIDQNMQDIERVIAAAAQMELKLPARSVRARTRAAIADYLDRVVRPHVADPEIHKLSQRLRDTRKGYDIGVRLSNGKPMIRWDNKAGLKLLCPDDAREEAKRVSKQYVPKIMEELARGRTAHYVCLTEPNSEPGKLRAGMARIFRRFNSIMRACKRKNRPFPIVGALAILEAPLGASMTWHPHLNVLLICDGFLDYGKFRERWHWNVELRKLEGSQAVVESALRELIKYSVRALPEKSDAKARAATAARSESRADCGPRAAPGRQRDGSAASTGTAGCVLPEHGSQRAALPEEGHAEKRPPALTQYPVAFFLEWWRACQGFRRTRSYGCLYGLPKPPKEDTSDTAWIGRGDRVGDRYVERFPLLESIPGDKSTTASLVDRYRRAIQELHGPPDDARRALELTAQAMQAWERVKNLLP